MYLSPQGRARAEAIWDSDKTRHYHFFIIADPNDKVCAVLGTYSYNGVATEIMSARTHYGNLRRIFPPRICCIGT